MPSQFSALGFTITSGEDLAALASAVADRTDTIDAAEGQYLKWAPPSGEQLWLQVRRNGDAMGMNPHFEGKSVVRIGLEARVSRHTHTPLDGTFLAWANPPAGASTGGDYPFAFDCPDAAVHAELELPIVVEAQIAPSPSSSPSMRRKRPTRRHRPPKAWLSARARSFRRGLSHRRANRSHRQSRTR